ncbi:MAG: hypothetical protein IT219_11545 [Bacteroidales bacterium]|nr:hypothetical protein [Bacteroidales bacterium]
MYVGILFIFSLVNCRIFLSLLQLAVTVTYMKCWGLRASSLSAVTKVGAGQNGSYKHLNPNILYMMLGAGVNSFLSVYQLFSYNFISIINPHKPIHEAQIYFVFCGWANPKALWANRAGKAEALLQAFGFSDGSCGLANVHESEGMGVVA